MKRTLLTLLQILITLFLLWWIFHDPLKRQQMREALHTANYLWLVPGVLATGLAFLLQTQRWRILLRTQNINLGWWRTVRVYLIGAFFNLFLFGATGGDIIKIYYAMRETTSKSAAFLSVLVDRMMGLIGLVAMAALLCSFRLDLLLSTHDSRLVMGSLALIMGAALGLVVAGFVVDRFHLAHKLPKWLPLHARILELATAFSTYARDGKVLLITFGLSLPAHLLNFLAFYFSARAFGYFGGPGGVFDILSVLPAIMAIAALPISLAGVGVREQLFNNMLNQLYATPESTAVMISIMGFLMTVFWGLVGGLVYLAYRPSGGLHLHELEEEVAAVEQSIEDKA